MLGILERMLQDLGGTYLLTDTDSMLIVASKRGGMVPCRGGPALKAISWKQVNQMCSQLNALNPYDRSIVGQILKIEDCNYDSAGKQDQLYGLAVSAKRYVVYKRNGPTFRIIKPSEHGLGLVYLPDERKRYKPTNCKDTENSYAHWVVEAWEIGRAHV